MSQPDVFSSSTSQQHLLEQLDQAWQRKAPSQTTTELGVLPVRSRRIPPPVPPRIPRKPLAKVEPVVTVRECQQSPNSPLRRSPSSAQQPTSHETARADPFAALSPLRPVSTNHHAASSQQNLPKPQTVSNVTSTSIQPEGDLPPVFIGVVGVTGSGKSTFINRVTGCKDIIVADGLQSGTRSVNQATVRIGQKVVHLVDTPGFNDTELEDEDVYYMIIDWLKDFHEKGQKLSALLYLHPINKTRERGSDVRSLRIFKRLVGESNFSSILIGLTFHDQEDPEIAASRQRTLCESKDFWADMVAAGARVVRIPFDKNECLAIVEAMAQKETITLQAEKELFEENKPVQEMTAMQEMQDHAELKLIRMKEEMEQAAQQMLFDERIRLTTDFSTERATLEQQLFEERRAKQILEEEVLVWKQACEDEKEELRTTKLQHEREEGVRKRKIEQTKREEAASEQTRQLNAIAEQRERERKLEYASDQATRMTAYLLSKTNLLARYMAMRKREDCQGFQFTMTNKGGVVSAGQLCNVCWSYLPLDEPSLIFSRNGTQTLSICTNRACLETVEGCIESDQWERQWHFPLLTDCKTQCRRWTHPTSILVCSCCRNRLAGWYFHCCKCDRDDFDICLDCYTVKERGCRSRTLHILQAVFLYEEVARLEIVPARKEQRQKEMAREPVMATTSLSRQETVRVATSPSQRNKGFESWWESS